MFFKCSICKREFTTKGGRTYHQKFCEKKQRENTEKTENAASEADNITLPNIDVTCKQTKTLTSPTMTSVWGIHDREDLAQIINAIYEEIVLWKRNIFKVPSGNAGKKYIMELTRLIDAWNDDINGLNGIALKAAMVMPSVLLQKPNQKSTSKENADHLKRRLEWWDAGDFEKIMDEARTVQQRMKQHFKSKIESQQSISKKFANFMMKGQVQAAIRLLDEAETKGIADLNGDVLNTLKSQHPDSQPASPETLMQGEPQIPNPIIYESIDASVIQKAALHTKGAAGPSGMDANGWRRILISRNFGKTTDDLCKSVAKMAKKLCTTNIEIETINGNTTLSIESYIACRLIPLEKKPSGVRPIGIGEVLRRIIGKAILSVFKSDVMNGAGSLQLCAGQSSGCEAAIHAMTNIFEEDETDGILLVDASNAFNAINRNALLHNIQYLCPVLATYIINCYQHPSRLFIMGGKEILSKEGTTQGDPLAMPTYAIGLTPLLATIKTNDETKHVAYADDLAGIGKLLNLRKWWDDIMINGPLIGYKPNAKKSWVVVKNEHLEQALDIFKGTGVNVTSAGRKYLGGAIGANEFQQNHIRQLVSSWTSKIEKLATIAKSEPQAALAAFNSGLKHKFTFHMRSMKAVKDHVQPAEDAIRNLLIPALTDGHHCSDHERRLLALPPRLGGLGIPILTNIAEKQYTNSKLLTMPLSTRIKNQDTDIGELVAQTNKIKNQITKTNREDDEKELHALRREMTADDLKANDIAQMKGSSSWITTLPLADENYDLNKREFYDAICIRYRWDVKHLPITCVCGSPFTIDHAMTCKKGGYVIQRHNEIRDTIAHTLEDVCHDVKIEPQLLPLTGEHLNPRANKSNEARLDVSAVGFWTRGDRAFFDVRVFNPFAFKYRQQKLDKSLASNEQEKKKAYNQRVIEVEHGSFTPLVFTTNGGMGRECQHFLTTLAEKISRKKHQQYSEVINWLRTKLSFAVIRSLVLALRGYRGKPKTITVNAGEAMLANAESKIEN